MQEGLGLAAQALLGGIEERAWVLWTGERPPLLHISLSGLKTSLDYSNGHIPQACEHREAGRGFADLVHCSHQSWDPEQCWEVLTEWMGGSVSS